MKKKCECGQVFIFLLNFKTGKMIPVEVESIIPEEMKSLEDGITVAFNGVHHVNHFANCPQRDKFRRDKKK